ncbi:hypothetical protein ACP26L_09305 [Paenibacillus sp. S-38]|uniref:hypothetical protein n=1 Tax=Paenibacillus sp. S-38 TaxID=3416710 RepID=UPI003CE81AAD
MAKSKAARLRRRLEREGNLNPEIHRGSWRGLVPVERTTPTKRESLTRQENKHKKKWNRTPQGSDGSISFCAAGRADAAASDAGGIRLYAASSRARPALRLPGL